jgi:hypothetical protein
MARFIILSADDALEAVRRRLPELRLRATDLQRLEVARERGDQEHREQQPGRGVHLRRVLLEEGVG